MISMLVLLPSLLHAHDAIVIWAKLFGRESKRKLSIHAIYMRLLQITGFLVLPFLAAHLAHASVPAHLLASVKT